MKKTLLVFLLLLAAVAMSGQSYENLWQQYVNNRELKPQTALGQLDRMIRKAESEGAAGQLLRAQMAKGQLLSIISPDSVAPFIANVKRREATCRQKSPVLGAVYAAFLHRQIAADTLYRHLALANKPLLAATKASDFAPAVELGADSRYFGNDLLSVIGYYIGDFRSLNSYYTRTGNRTAALLTGLKLLDAKRPSNITQAHSSRFIHSLDSLRSLYADLDLAAEIAKAKYRVLAGCTDVTDQQRYSFLTEALQRYRNYVHLEYLKNSLAYLTRPSCSLKLLKDVCTTSDSVRLTFHNRNLHSAQVAMYRVLLSSVEYDALTSQQRSFAALDSASSLQYLPGREVSRHWQPAQPYADSADTLFIEPLPVGIYLLRITAPEADNAPTSMLLRVSNLRVLSLGLPGNNSCRVVVVDALTGRPVPGASVRHGGRLYNCNSEGELTVKGNGKPLWVYTDGDRACPAVNAHSYNDYDDDDESVDELSLYTDRQVYRPGQTVNVAGIYYRRRHRDFQAKPNKRLTLFLYDANSEQVGEQQAVTDDFGTFSASFKLPKGGLTGTFLIGGEDGSVSFRVEEYKRPTFEVTVDAVTYAYTAGDTLHLQGHARSLMGEPVQRAAVEYSLYRRVGFDQPNLDTRPDTVLTTQTDTAGNFTLHVPLTADFSENKDLSYTFQVVARVTDAAGESCENQQWFNLSAKPVSISTTFYDDQIMEQPSIEQAKFFISNNNNTHIEGQLNYWYKGYEGQVFTWRTGDKAGLQLPSGFVTGQLQLVAVCRGDTLRRRFVLMDKQQRRPCYHTGEWFWTDYGLFDPTGRTPSTVYIGSSERDVHAYYVVYSNSRRIESGTLDFSDSICALPFRYKSEYGDGIVVAVAWYRNGRGHAHTFMLRTPSPDKSLQLKWQTFRNRLRPGDTEEWQLRITKPDGRPAAAQLMATLYDKALDRVAGKHEWEFSTYFNRALPSVEWEFSRSTWSWQSMAAKPQLVPETGLALSQLALGGLLGMVQGTVTDAYGEPVIGCTVQVPGTQRATVTGMDGRFSIRASVGEVLQFRYIGMETKEQTVAYGSMDVVLEDSGADLQEVVVGYGKGSSRSTHYTGAAVEYALAGSVRSASSALYGSRAAEDPSLLVDFDRLSAGSSEAVDPLRGLPVRENLNETAFFMPRLVADADGKVSIRFTAPESITAWRFLGLAHTRNLDCGLIGADATTSKDFMVQPNQPRFLRVGDRGTISARIFNTTKRAIKGAALLQLIDPETERTVYQQRSEFSAPASGQQSVSFDYTPQASDPSLLICKIVASAGGASDGEQHYLPVVTNRELSLRTFTFTLTEPGERSFDLRELFPTPDKDNLLTVEYTANPSWLLIPALHRYAHPWDDCALCQAGSYYVNTLARHILTSVPAVEAAVKEWEKDTTMVSPLQRNEQVKNILLVETPWVAASQRETRQGAELADFFREGRINAELHSALRKLRRLQRADGSWSWFPGMDGSFYVTLSVTETLARLGTITGNDKDAAELLQPAFGYLGKQIVKAEADLRKRGERQLTADMLEYLYTCAIAQPPLPADVQAANARLIGLIEANEPLQSMLSRALSAVILYHAGHAAKARIYVESLKEHTVYRDDRGRYFDSPRAVASWRSYKIPTQVAAIEAMQLVTPADSTTIGQMQRWLLQEKRTQYWENSVVTVDAVHAFMAGRSNVFSTRISPFSIEADANVHASPAAAAVGYLKETVLPDGGTRLTIKKEAPGMSWGTVYAQRMSPAADIEPSGTELHVKREIVKNGRVVAANGMAEAEPLRVGDKVTVRLTITAERDLDFVQVSDKRPACLEPVGQQSGYDPTLRCYCSLKDTQTQYFFDKLRKGTWVIEHPYFVDRAGTYASGTVTVQCAYAPEFYGTEGTVVLKSLPQASLP